MKVPVVQVEQRQLAYNLKQWLSEPSRRLGLISSLDGSQLVTLVLDTAEASAQCWLSPLDSDVYHSLTPDIPQAHWFERALNDLFAVTAYHHPRLKQILSLPACKDCFEPLRRAAHCQCTEHTHKKDNSYLHVKGEGVYEIPVGPVHAGIIEPGHFRLNCLGETIVNLEIRLGFLHRGVEKRLTEVPWKNARFVAEAAASDTAAAGALAHSIALESIAEITVPERAQYLRSLALEIERIAMHTGDLGGMAVDLGWGGLAACLSRLRGTALDMAALLSGQRFLRGFICPGGVSSDPDVHLSQIRKTAGQLTRELEPVLDMFFDSSHVLDRTVEVGKVSDSLAREFGLVGIAARASGIAYDARRHFHCGVYPSMAPPAALETAGDAQARLKIRAAEITASLKLIGLFLDGIEGGDVCGVLPGALPDNSIGAGIVEAFRGELIHLIFTAEKGSISRYCIKDPSFNNWTALAIAARNNLVADFPVCNKSFSLSYSGHDL